MNKESDSVCYNMYHTGNLLRITRRKENPPDWSYFIVVDLNESENKCLVWFDDEGFIEYQYSFVKREFNGAAFITELLHEIYP